jgi:hypothetical protein
VSEQEQYGELAYYTLAHPLFIGLVGYQPAYGAPPPQCKKFHVNAKASKALEDVVLPPAQGGCTPKMSNGFQIPDPSCSPGAINPTLTLKVLKTKGFTTKCVRDLANGRRIGSASR